MSVLESGSGTALMDIETTKAARTVVVARGVGHAITGITGTMAAALGANSSIFIARLDPSAAVRAYIDRIRIQWTTLTAFTTPATAGRRIAIFRGAGATPSGGTLLPPVQKHSALATSEFLNANGGDARIATTAALTVTSITFETDPIATISLTQLGAAAAYAEWILDFGDSVSAPIVLEPGQLIAIRNPVAMDAAGTFQMVVNMQHREAKLLSETP